MSTATTLERPLPAADESAEGSAKRRQILEGAREAFLTQGFDAASMGEIARAAGVSKGTLYVYFKNKEELFQAIVQEQCGGQAVHIFDLDPQDHDVEAVMTRLGNALVEFLCRVAASAPMRTVIAISDRMPELGRQFYESGPARGIAKLEAYLKAQVDAGVLAIEDCHVAAAQFIEGCQAPLFKPVLFNAAPRPTPERISYVVRIAVRAFLAAYRA